MKYTAADIDRYIDLYLNSFEKVLYEEDSQFMEGMKTRSLAGDDIRRYQFWEWTQGVGLYGCLLYTSGRALFRGGSGSH